MQQSKRYEKLLTNLSRLPSTRLSHCTSALLLTRRDLSMQISGKMKDQVLAGIFTNCLPNTLDTTVQHFSDDPTNPDTFIITGDITAMWQRDSSAQVSPYIQFANLDSRLKRMLKGLILRQSRNMLLDPYANAFLYTAGLSPWISDHRIPKMGPQLWEGKYELDSLAWPIRLATQYWQSTQDFSICNNSTFISAMQLALKAIQYQQQPVDVMSQNDPLFYGFGRYTQNSIDTLFSFVGQPGAATGLSRSPFRPSDDSHVLPYSVAANAMASVVLNDLSSMLQNPMCANALGASEVATMAASLSAQIRSAVMQYGPSLSSSGIATHYAYEVDGFGGSYSMDDANVPSLLSLPYLGFVNASDSLYVATRKRILSNRNPYWTKGTAGSGIGSPHTGIGKIWPISVIMQALTSQNDQEIKACLSILKNSAASTGFMHESFDRNDPNKYTRSWFAWANSLFGELILTIAKERPHIIF